MHQVSAFKYTSKLLMGYTDYFMIFYVKRFWKMLHIYYKEKVN